MNTYSVYDDPVEKDIAVADVVGQSKLPANIPELRASRDVFFVKTHELPVDECPAIYVVRDGRDALVSHARYLQTFRTKRRRFSWLHNSRKEFERTLRKLIAEKPQFGGWSRHVEQWTKRAGPTVLVRFRNLIAQPQLEVERAFAQLDFPVPAKDGGKVPAFEELHAKNPQFFRKGKVGVWREEMPEHLHQLFLQHNEQTLKELGL